MILRPGLNWLVLYEAIRMLSLESAERAHMIARSQPKNEPVRWQIELREAYSRPRELCAALGLNPAEVELSEAAADSFSMRVPRPFVARMQYGDPADPLLRQVLPTASEIRVRHGYGSDPVGDIAAEKAPGLLHKYRGRVLLLATG